MKLKILTILAFYCRQLIQEYLELLKDLLLNKKTGIKKGSTGLGFENFAQRIKSL